MIYDIRPTTATPSLPLIPVLLNIYHHQEPIHRPKGVDFYQWFYCVQGRGELKTGQQRSIITEGQGFLIYPQIAHTYKPLTPDWTVHCIGFSGPMCADILKFLHMSDSGVYHFSNTDVFSKHLFALYNLLVKPSPHMDADTSSSYANTIDSDFTSADIKNLTFKNNDILSLSCTNTDTSINNFFENKSAPHSHVVHVRFPSFPEQTFYEASKICYSFLLDLSKCITMILPSAYIPENDIVHKMITYLEENYKHPIVLNDMAEYVGLSKEYMCSLFKSAMHQTIMQYLLELRIAQARILLIQYPEKTVKEISALCGFESPSYFGSQFKRVTSTTPENYRRGLSI